ncbi:hypothetical protein [Rickettsia sp. Tenjiku01]|uniref:hypothetical protein n=1 Tax=Rickettsia sp. Tenjiku01 TaxID=1736693 RepID=UPI0007DB272E
MYWGEYYNNVEQTDLYLKAVASLRQTALYTSKPKDTDVLLGKAFYKAGKLSEAGTVLNKYIYLVQRMRKNFRKCSVK